MFIATLVASVALGRQAPVGEVPFAIEGGQIIVEATLNKRSLRLIFDTGYGGSVICDTTVDIGKPNGTETLQDFVGTLEVATVPIKSLLFGKIPIPMGGEEANQQPGVSRMSGATHIDGLMGFSVIKDSITEINFKDKKFVFHPATEDLSKRKPDNKTTFLVPMEPLGARAIVLPVTTPSGKPCHMALDTGNAFYATLNRDALERVGLWPEGQAPKFMSEAGVASGTVKSWYKRLKNMNIFTVPVAESVWDIIDRPASNSLSDGTVGFQFLQNFNITFDFKKRLVWLENWSGKVSEPAEGNLGIAAAWSKRSESAIVFFVSPDSPAEKAGIKEGDHLLDLDDNDLTNMSYTRMRKLLAGPVGSKVKLSVSHDGVSRRLTLVREELVNP